MTGTPERGRHRLGTTGLRHCRDIDSVDARLAPHRGAHRRPRRSGPSVAGRLVTTLGAAVVTAVVAVSGWYTAAGATAVAQMISP